MAYVFLALDLYTSSIITASSSARSLTSKPTLPQLLNLKTSSGSTVRVVQQIGTHYSTLGPLLLDDVNGAVIPAITNQHHHNAVAINQEILTQWLQGQGKLPVTWSTLLDVLRDAGLSELTEMVQKSLNITSPAKISGETVTDMQLHIVNIFITVPPYVAAVQSPAAVTTQIPQQRSGKLSVVTLYHSCDKQVYFSLKSHTFLPLIMRHISHHHLQKVLS